MSNNLPLPEIEGDFSLIDKYLDEESLNNVRFNGIRSLESLQNTKAKDELHAYIYGFLIHKINIILGPKITKIEKEQITIKSAIESVLNYLENSNNVWDRVVYTKIENCRIKYEKSELEREKILLKEANAKLEITSCTDHLTGAYNRRFIESYINGILDRNKRIEKQNELNSEKNLPHVDEKQYSILVIDIDHFKSINDTFSHAIGDNTIKEIINIINSTKRAGDMVGRLGGEEFIVILEDTDLEGGYNGAEKIRKKVESELVKVLPTSNTTHKKVTCSIGVTHISKCDGNYEEPIDRADQGLYDAKESGRNQVCIKPKNH